MGLIILAGCRDSESLPIAMPVEIKVTNQGSSSVHGRAEDWDETDPLDFTLQPGESRKFVVASEYRVKLHVWRDSDETLLFDDFWDVSAILDSGVNVTVYP